MPKTRVRQNIITKHRAKMREKIRKIRNEPEPTAAPSGERDTERKVSKSTTRQDLEKPSASSAPR